MCTHRDSRLQSFLSRSSQNTWGIQSQHKDPYRQDISDSSYQHEDLCQIRDIKINQFSRIPHIILCIRIQVSLTLFGTQSIFLISYRSAFIRDAISSQIINFLFIKLQLRGCPTLIIIVFAGHDKQADGYLDDIISPLTKIFMQTFQNRKLIIIFMKRGKSNIQIKISDLENETVSLKNVDFSVLDQYRERFKKCIQQPIRVYQQLCQQKFPQKCMIHGMGYALYCMTDNKLICSRCMYQNNAHRNHSVKPMNQCLSNISNECQKTMKEIKQIAENILGLDQYVKKQIFMIERQFPQAKQKIQSIFKSLHQFLFDQQKWCMKEIRQFKAELIEQKNLLSKQIYNTKLYIEDTLSKYHNKTSTEELLAKKSIYESLLYIPEVIKQLKIDPNNSDPKFKFNDQIQENVLSFFKEKFMTLLPWGKEKKQKELSKSKSPRSKSIKKSDSKKIPKKQKIKEEPKPEKSLNNSKQKMIRLKNQTLSPLSSTKNRPSKSCKYMFGESPKNRRSYLMTKNSLLVNGQQKLRGLSPKNQQKLTNSQQLQFYNSKDNKKR